MRTLFYHEQFGNNFVKQIRNLFQRETLTAKVDNSVIEELLVLSISRRGKFD